MRQRDMMMCLHENGSVTVRVRRRTNQAPTPMVEQVGTFGSQPGKCTHLLKDPLFLMYSLFPIFLTFYISDEFVIYTVPSEKHLNSLSLSVVTNLPQRVTEPSRKIPYTVGKPLQTFHKTDWALCLYIA